jgi:PAS domain S-box-containing protein
MTPPTGERAPAGASPAELTHAQFGELFDCAPNCIVVVDFSFRFVYANRPALELLGVPDLIGQNIFELFPGNLAEPFHSAYRGTMEQRTPNEFEAYFAKPLNRWFKVTTSPFAIGIVIFFQDITDRKQAEGLRDAATTRLEQVFEVTNDAIVTLNRKWEYTFVNRRARELLATKGDLIGKTVWDEFPATANPESPYYIAYHRTMDERLVSRFEAYYPEPLNMFLEVETRPFDDGMVAFFRDITERRVAEQAIQDQQELLGTIQQAARMATWDLDLSTGVIAYGPGSYPVYGHPLESIATRASFREIVAPAHRERVKEALAGRAHGEMVTVDYQVKTADGRLIWVESRGQRIGSEGTRIGGVAIDITARKQGEEALAASEERYRILADLNPQAIWMGAPDGTITYANQGFLDYIGLGLNDIGGLGWLEAFYIDDRPKVVAAWTRSVDTGEEYNVEARIVRAKDGAVRIWCLRGLPVRGEDGAILHWLGVAMDVDDTRSSAKALERKQEETERQRAELETIYQTAGIGLSLLSVDDFRFLRINDRQAEMIGLPPEEIIGKPLTELTPIAPKMEEMIRVAALGTPIRDLIVENGLPPHSVEHRIFNVSYTPVYASDHSVQAITALSLDITHQKKAEAALVQSEKLAAVGRLASSISHEINNPLEAITNLLYLIALSEGLPEELKVYVHMAQSELSRVSQIATQTLRFHRQAVKPTAVTAGELVDAVLNLYQGRLMNSGIRVDARYKSKTRVFCFENDIRQVLNNLIANAIDAMRNGGRLIARAHDVHDSATGRSGVRITIADTGHGMSKQVLGRVFEPFYTTKDLNGTGLGLWISSGIVERHQGTLTVKSSEDPTHHGTIFSLFLPDKDTPMEYPNELDGRRYR